MTESGWDLRRRRVAHAIEEVALDCFARDGYHQVTVEQIAQAAGIHERTFFRYFASKDDVMLALPRRSIDVLCSALRSRPGEESLSVAFVAAVREAATKLGDDANLRVVSGRVFLETSDLVPRATGELGTLLSSSVAGAVADRLGDSADSLRVGVVTSVLTAVTFHVWNRWLLDGGVGDVARLLQSAFDLLEEAHFGTEGTDRAEMERLQSQVAELTIERDIFKRAAALLVQAEV
ncbi:MAG TPA: TetR family transcriptional regulator [Acidimicrobiales bacterium]|jgi:AcrR family transcriptional regulator